MLGSAAPFADPLLREFWASYPAIDGVPQISIQSTSRGLQATWHTTPVGALTYIIDIENFVKQQRSYPAPKQGAFNQALGRKTKHIIDATAGWGGDAMLMCAQGYRVTMLERNPVMALLLTDAMQRLARSEWAEDHQVLVPSVLETDAIHYLSSLKSSVDCIYLDPMFPAKRKKTAAVNKNIQLLQWLVGVDSDAVELARAAVNSNCSRVVVKRPDYALPLLDLPITRFSSKLVHYDVYLKDVSLEAMTS